MLIVLFQLFNFADFAFSYNTIIVNGIAEGNPILSYLMSLYGDLEVLIAAKVIAAILGLFFYKWASAITLVIVTAVYGLLTAYHVYLTFLVV